MKSVLLSVVAAMAIVLVAQADNASVVISNVHLCCDGCVKGVDKALSGVDGASVACNKDAKTVVITAPDKATLQKAADALVAAGFFGVSSDPDIKINADTGAKGEQVKYMQITGVHLCCGKCVKAVNMALKDVSGVTTNTAAKGVHSFAVIGNFKDSDVFDALQKAGLTGKEAP